VGGASLCNLSSTAVASLLERTSRADPAECECRTEHGGGAAAANRRCTHRSSSQATLVHGPILIGCKLVPHLTLQSVWTKTLVFFPGTAITNESHSEFVIYSSSFLFPPMQRTVFP
jgi:hypothetical protein